MITIDNLSKKLDNKQILNGLSLFVGKSETLALIGGSGTGKSVTLKHIIGLMQPDSGSVTVDGHRVSSGRIPDIEAARRKIGFLFQSAALINWLSVFDNVALPLREHTDLSETEIHSRVMEKLRLLGLEDASEKMPDAISGGMKKRAGLARAVIRDPKIVLYDEPTTGLDPVKAADIDQMIKDAGDKFHVTQVVVTHDMDSAFAIADRVSMLYQGKIITTGTPDEFRDITDPVVRAFIRGDNKHAG